MTYSMTDGLTSWQPRNTASNAQQRATRSASCYPNSTMRPWSPYHQRVMLLTDLTNHHVVGTKRKLKPSTSSHHLAIKTGEWRLQNIHMTYDRTWTIEPDKPDQSMDQGGVPQHEKTAIRPGATSTISPRPKTAYGLHPNCTVTRPAIGAPHTPYASPMR